MKAKCVNNNCGHEFENQNESTFFDTIDEGDILFEINNETYNVIGYVFCPVCGHQCAEVD